MDATTLFPLTVTGTESAFKRPVGAARSFWIVLTRGTLAAAGLHLLFGVWFAALGLVPLVALNLASALVYVLAWQLFKRRRNRPAVLLIWIEVPLHAALSSYALGWDSGFHYYLLTFVPVIFVSSSRRQGSKIALMGLLCLLYLLMDAGLRAHLPAYTLAPLWFGGLRYANICITFLILGYLTACYLRAVGQAERRLLEMAVTDPLTGLANRRHAEHLARCEIEARRASGEPLSFVLADIDHFKSINDRFGHEVGDRVLQWVAELLRHAVREHDCVARWGGEEFLIVMPCTDLPTACRVAERLRQALSTARAPAGVDGVPLSMTFGVDSFDAEDTLDTCVARADAALYRGKKQGRNRVVAAG